MTGLLLDPAGAISAGAGPAGVLLGDDVAGAVVLVAMVVLLAGVLLAGRRAERAATDTSRDRPPG